MADPITLFLLIGSALTTARAQSNAGKAQQIELDKQADEEKIAAEGRELQRRQELNKVLSANIVGQSTSGMAGEGTPESIALESSKQASISEGVIGLSEKLKRSQLRRKGKNAKSLGNMQAASTLLKSAVEVDSVGGFDALK